MDRLSSLNEVVTASAPAKIILFGEHFVVYGQSAVVLAIDKRAYVSAKLRTDRQTYVNSTDLGVSGFFNGEGFQPERGSYTARTSLEPIQRAAHHVLEEAGKRVGIDLEVHSSIPVASGLGSSAAVTSATVLAVSHLLNVELSQEEIFNFTLKSERLIHGTPSGIDPAISTYGGTLLFHKDRGVSPLKVDTDIPLVVGNTNVARSTGELVAAVRQRLNNFPSIIGPIIESGGRVALEAVEALKKGDLSTVGELMNINQSLLNGLGVSHETLERLISAARTSGAYGAKLTGGGGGGCMIALAKTETLKHIATAIERAGGTIFIAKKEDHGVRIEL